MSAGGQDALVVVLEHQRRRPPRSRRGCRQQALDFQPTISASSSSSSDTICCDRAEFASGGVRRRPSRRARIGADLAQHLLDDLAPRSSPRAHEGAVAPIATTFWATLAAPPRASSFSRTRTTGRGPQGNPVQIASQIHVDMASPTIAPRLFRAAESRSRAGPARLSRSCVAEVNPTTERQTKRPCLSRRFGATLPPTITSTI